MTVFTVLIDTRVGIIRLFYTMNRDETLLSYWYMGNYYDIRKRMFYRGLLLKITFH